MAKVLDSLSEDLASLVDAVSPSVVRVEGRRRLPATGIVWSAEGAVITANHVVQREEGLKVGMHDGSTLSAQLLGRDPTTDLALLQTEGGRLTEPQWADEVDVAVGQLVLAVGRPRASAQATLGIVSALGGGWRTPVGGHVDRYLQTDVVMYPGFSGGPLVGAGGGLLGLNSSALQRGVSLALPPSTLRRVTQELKDHGTVRRGYLGIVAQPVELPAKLAEELDQRTGLLLVRVEAAGPAEGSGLTMGDTLLSVAGEPTRSLDELLAQLSGDRIGQTVAVRVLRGGELLEAEVAIGERGES